jgi:glutamate/tyrosine decarboxylase-like PLP-dependent enzyme
MRALLQETAQRAIRYVEGVDQRRVFPLADDLADLQRFDEALPEEPLDPQQVIQMLDEIGSPATVATTGPRYYGFVTGGILPAALAANWLMSAWDQNGVLRVLSPISARLEDLALDWMVDALGLEAGTGGGIVTGATMANFSGLAAARHYILERAGWDAEAKGLFGAPEVKVVVGQEVHVSLIQALGMLGLGRERVIVVPADEQGRMRADQLPALDEMTIVCIQAGNVNSGAFDPAEEICAAAHAAGAWVHVDGAFGLWAMVLPELAHLTRGLAQADSWSTDGHKWMNVSYDNGFVFCRYPQAMRAALAIGAVYLVEGAQREPGHYTPEQSRRARGVEIWAALKSLGRRGLQDLIRNDCQLAQRFAQGLRAAGIEVLNEVVINQVFAAFGDDEITAKIIAAVQADGTMWAGPSHWHGRSGMRLSVSSWKTRAEDIDRSVEAIVRCTDSVRSSQK